MLVVVEAMFDTNERLSRRFGKTTIPTVECKVMVILTGMVFINDFMKEIHVIEIKPEG